MFEFSKDPASRMLIWKKSKASRCLEDSQSLIIFWIILSLPLCSAHLLSRYKEMWLINHYITLTTLPYGVSGQTDYSLARKSIFLGFHSTILEKTLVTSEIWPLSLWCENMKEIYKNDRIQHMLVVENNDLHVITKDGDHDDGDNCNIFNFIIRWNIIKLYYS